MATGGRSGGAKTGGRQAGTPNKITGDLRNMILGALAGAGGEAYLQRQATQNPGAFLTLIGKVLPTTLETSGAGIVVQLVTGVRRAAEDDTPSSQD